MGDSLFKARVAILTMVTRPDFAGTTQDLRLAVTGQWKDRDALHGHGQDGRSLYRLPPVRYLGGKEPRIVAVGQGIEQLQEIYHSLGTQLRVRGRVFRVIATELTEKTVDFGLDDTLYEYKTVTPWLALNQEKYHRYIRMGVAAERRALLESVFVGNLLALSKGLGYTVEGRIMAKIHQWSEQDVTVKDVPVLGFRARITTNFILPVELGIGKHAALGFGRFKV